MLFWIEKDGKRVFVDALLNCGRYYVTFWQDGKRVKPDKHLIEEATAYIRSLTDKPVEIAC